MGSNFTRTHSSPNSNIFYMVSFISCLVYPSLKLTALTKIHSTSRIIYLAYFGRLLCCIRINHAIMDNTLCSSNTITIWLVARKFRGVLVNTCFWVLAFTKETLFLNQLRNDFFASLCLSGGSRGPPVGARERARQRPDPSSGVTRLVLLLLRVWVSGFVSKTPY